MKKFNSKLPYIFIKNNHGFTLKEFLYVILVLAVIVLFLTPNMSIIYKKSIDQSNTEIIAEYIKNDDNLSEETNSNKNEEKTLDNDNINVIDDNNEVIKEENNSTNNESSSNQIEKQNDTMDKDSVDKSSETKNNENNNSSKNVTDSTKSNDKSEFSNKNQENTVLVTENKKKTYTKYASDNGKLYVKGTKLKNERGEDFRLTGVVLDGNYKENKVLHSKKSFETIKNWGANLIRVFVEANKTYSGQYVYLNNEKEYLNYLYEVIDNAIYNDMYVMVVWEPGQDNPMVDKSTELFTTIAKKYPNDYHIIYEVWNEPQHVPNWNYLKTYSTSVINAIRKISPDSLIIVNPVNMEWVKSDKLNYSNIMYTDHTYAGGMHGEAFEEIISAVEAGIPIFETEWSGVSLNSNEIRTYHIKETHATAWIKLLNKYNISYAYFAFKPNTAAYGFTKEGVWDESLPDSILTPNAKFFKKIVGNNYNYSVNLMKWNGNKTKIVARDYRSDEWREKIVSIDFKTKLEVPKNAVVTWDLSAQQDKSVIGYLVSNGNDTYKMTICANGKINAPIYSNYLFSGMTNLKSIDFTNFETSEVVSMSYMFADDKSLESLDLSGFNTNKLENMVLMFRNCSSLKSISFNNWKAKIKDIRFAFQGCSKIESIDLSGIDVSSNKDFAYMFDFNTYLKKVNISTWDPVEVSSIKSMFRGCNNIEEINMARFNIQDSTEINDIFINSSIKSDKVTIVVRNSDVANILERNISSSIPLNIVYGFNDDSGKSGSVNWSYVGSTGTLNITGSGSMADYSEGTAPWYKYRENIVSVNIGEDVTKLGKYAFYNLTYVKNFRIDAKSLDSLSSSTVHTGDNYTMYNVGMRYGATLTFGSNVTKIPAMLLMPAGFGYNHKINKVVFEGNKITIVEKYGLAYLQIPILVLKEGHTTNALHSYGYGDMYLIVLPNSLKNIADVSLNSNSKLEKLVFGPSVDNIGSYVLNSDKNLRTLVVPHIEKTSVSNASIFSKTTDHTVTIYGDDSTKTWVENIITASGQTNLIYKDIKEYKSSITSNTDISGSVGYNESYSFTISGNVKAYYRYVNSSGTVILSDEIDIQKVDNTYTISNIKNDIYIEIN